MNKRLIAGLSLATILGSASAMEMMAPTVNLGVGARGTAVTNLQNILADKGYLSATARGYFGPATRAALMKYQIDNSISSTGYYGPLTRASLGMSVSMNMSGSMMNPAFTAAEQQEIMMNDMATDKMGVMVGGAMMLSSRDIVDNAVLANNVTTVVAAVKAAGLVDTLKSAGPFTVFAPTNDAFAKLPAGTVESLLTPEKKADLSSILTYHVVAGRYKAIDLTNGLKLKTVNGKDLTFTKDMNGNIMINGTSKILVRDITSTNGVTFAIDTVLLP